MGMWLIEENAWRDVQAARAYPIASITADLREQFATKIKASRDSGPLSLSVKGDEAIIAINGVLTAEEDFWLWLFDIPNTTYADIQGAIAQAEGDPRVKSVQFVVSSPGGEVDGLFETTSLQAMMKKPKSTIATLAASAAFALAANGGKITAASHASTFGSVGVVASYRIDETRVDITSTEAPEKRPDPATPKGQAAIRTYLDQIHDLYAETIAAGRGTTVDKVNAGYGRGNVMLASDAKSRGMIDKIIGQRPLESSTRASAQQPTEEPPAPVVTEAKPSATDEGVAQKAGTMDLKKLKAEHPDVFEAAVQETLKEERDRVEAHLVAGEMSGDLKTAIEAVRSGAKMTSALQTKYMMTAANRRDVRNRESEEEVVEQAADNVTKKPAEEPKSFADTVFAKMNAAKGKVV